MALDTYANLQIAVLEWLARPGDALVSPSVPDMITLFESEARRRMKTRFSEAALSFATVGGTATVALPSDFYEPRSLRLNTNPLAQMTYVTPAQMDSMWGGSQTEQPEAFTIEGLNLRFAPVPDGIYSGRLEYMQGITALSDAVTTNWLLTNYPDAYLFGTLAEAEAFIANDERITLWLQRRDAAFESILSSDRKARWGGGPLQIKTDTGNP